MAVSLKRTKDVRVNGVKVLVYGPAGAGKTYLISTAPNPVILSAESGLLSLQDVDIPYWEISSLETLREAYLWVRDSEEAKAFETICLDSISEIAEVVLNHEKRTAKDPRQAYGAMQDQMTEMIRLFRDLPGRHVYFSAKLEKSQDETGRILYSPSMPGNKTGQALPYFFDEVLALQTEKDEKGVTHRGLFCMGDGLWTAKDRSGRLDKWESPDLTALFAKIGGAA